MDILTSAACLTSLLMGALGPDDAENKGEIVKRLVYHYSGGSPNAVSDSAEPQPGGGGEGGSKIEFVLCCGDDFTDEDMFRALNGLSGDALVEDHVFTVSVGARNKATLAKWHVLEPRDVLGNTSLLVAL